MSFLLWLSVILLVVICGFLIMLILIQKGRGGGLASAFGGAGGNTAFGSKTGDVLTWATSIIFGIFILLAISLNLLANKTGEQPAVTPTGVPRMVPPAGAPPADNGPVTPNPSAVPSTKP